MEVIQRVEVRAKGDRIGRRRRRDAILLVYLEVVEGSGYKWRFNW
jgi:hypothetical protein